MKLMRKSSEMGQNGQVLTYPDDTDRRNLRLRAEMDLDLDKTKESGSGSLRKKPA